MTKLRVEEDSSPRWQVFRSMRLVSALTLLSRVLGYVRDAATVALFGGTWQLDAFLTAFPIPNLFRRVFGEGAMTGAFLPVFVETRERRGAEEAWRFASLVLTLLTLVLVGVVALGEIAFYSISSWVSMAEHSALLLRLLQVLFPYLVLICVAAFLASILQSFGRFGWPAFAPVLLNLPWLAALGCVHLLGSGARLETWALVLAGAVMASGVLTLAVLYRGVRQCGGRFRWQLGWADVGVRQMLALLLPAALGGAVFQVNVVVDRLIAFYGTPVGGPSALYLGMRVTQFPLALIGIAMGTVAFAALSESAARGDQDGFRQTLSRGLNGVLALSLPAGVGLMVLAGPMMRLLFERMQFDQAASARSAAVLVMYSAGLWAYCLQQVLVRAYHARKDMWTPVRIGLPMVGVNLALNLALVRPLAERGLALATAVTATLQVALLAWGLRPWLGGDGWQRTWSLTVRSVFASAVMGGAVVASRRFLFPTAEGLWPRLVALGIPLAVGAGTYLLLSALLKIEEVWEFFHLRRTQGG